MPTFDLSTAAARRCLAGALLVLSSALLPPPAAAGELPAAGAQAPVAGTQVIELRTLFGDEAARRLAAPAADLPTGGVGGALGDYARHAAPWGKGEGASPRTPPAAAALFGAVATDDVPALQSLLAAGADPDARHPATGLTALMMTGSPAIARSLLAAGADPGLVDPQGATPLHHAVVADAGPELVSLLLSHGAPADVAAAGWNGMTPLLALRIVFVERRAAPSGLRMLALLAGAGADVDARDAAGETLLHAAVVNREPALLAALLDLGARTDVPDAEGLTALDRAAQLGRRDLLETLVARRAPERAATRGD